MLSTGDEKNTSFRECSLQKHWLRGKDMTACHYGNGDALRGNDGFDENSLMLKGGYNILCGLYCFKKVDLRCINFMSTSKMCWSSFTLEIKVALCAKLFDVMLVLDQSMRTYWHTMICGIQYCFENVKMTNTILHSWRWQAHPGSYSMNLCRISFPPYWNLSCNNIVLCLQTEQINDVLAMEIFKGLHEMTIRLGAEGSACVKRHCLGPVHGTVRAVTHCVSETQSGHTKLRWR